ncbi:expressed protein, partial [Batrachochytrium dendrobatidis JAM81]
MVVGDALAAARVTSILDAAKSATWANGSTSAAAGGSASSPLTVAERVSAEETSGKLSVSLSGLITVAAASDCLMPSFSSPASAVQAAALLALASICATEFFIFLSRESSDCAATGWMCEKRLLWFWL